jgi:hypothetical protein
MRDAAIRIQKLLQMIVIDDMDALGAQEFDAAALTTPERAAEVIHRGVDTGRARILIGADAVLVDILGRVSPTRAYRALARLESLLDGRSQAQAQAQVAESDDLTATVTAR